MPSTLNEAARELGVSQRQLREWIREGAPVVTRGSRGRGNKLTLDAQAIAAWRAARTAPRDAVRAALVALAAKVPEAIAAEIAELYETPLNHRGALWQLLGLPAVPAARLHLAAYVVTLDAVRGLIGEALGAANLPELDCDPEALSRLQKIARL